MKKVSRVICFTGLLCLINNALIGQTYICLDKAFNENNSPMTVKRKGLGSIGKYEFGPYKVISGKAGWINTKSKTGFFTGDTKIESNAKSSFMFTGQGMDTITANILYTSVTQIDEKYSFVFRTLTNWSNRELTESYEVYMAKYASLHDTSQWNLVIAYPVAGEITGEITPEMISLFKGVLANSQTTIDIVPEFRWENGQNTTIFKPVEGYIFNLNGATVAAVQVVPANKMFVWINRDLPENLKLILASTAATMLIRSEQECQ